MEALRPGNAPAVSPQVVPTMMSSSVIGEKTFIKPCKTILFPSLIQVIAEFFDHADAAG
ncbi:hypothetical protein SDC9_186747 [bioreactor metagenome]|uniref:Uncharacterized protein n=1 Tax=bioreactor metagenome TaxID=1076179 RepID=A0A645HLV9_9ZZZZ